MRRKAAKPKSQQRRTRPRPTQAADAATGSVLPMETQIGDRFTDEEGEWEVVSHPATLYGAKSLRARVRRTEQPGGRARGDVACM
jgi:hypothetical protein